MQVLHSAALLAVVQTMAYGAITALSTAADPRNRLIIMKNPGRGKQRAYLLSHVNKAWLATYADCNSSDDTPCTETATVAVVASISLLEHAINAGYVVTQNTLSSAVDVANLSVIQYLVEHHDVHVDSTHCESAARSGHLHVLQWLHGHVRDMGRSFEYAAGAGHLHILQWVSKHHRVLNKSINTPRICAAAAGHGDLHLCQMLRKARFHWNSSTCTAAASNGHLEFLKWARKKGCHWNSNVCDVAARHGHLEVLKWAIQNGCPRGNNTCETAARNGHVEVLQWATENGFVFNPQACLSILCIRHRVMDTTKFMAVLQYLHEQGCQLTGYTMCCAARYGSIDILQWLRDHGCVWSDDATRTAAAFGHLHVLKWLREQDCPWSSGVMPAAVQNRDVEMMQWLHDAGCPRANDSIGYDAQHTANLYVCKWVFDHGYPWYIPTTEMASVLCSEAERLADPDMLEWLMAREGIIQDRTKHWKVLIDTLRREKRARARRQK
jgi:hypothetical protein